MTRSVDNRWESLDKGRSEDTVPVFGGKPNACQNTRLCKEMVEHCAPVISGTPSQTLFQLEMVRLLFYCTEL